MNDRAFEVAFGPVVARILADEALASTHSVLKHWLSAGICDLDRPPDVTFRLTTDRPRDRAAIRPQIFVGEASSDGERLTMWDGRAWEASADPRVGEAAPRSWSYRPRNGTMLRMAERVPTPLFRFLHVHYFSPDEVRASTFLYRHLIPIVQTELLERGATFLHASAVRRRGGGGMLVCGWGGAGKTSGSAYLHLTRPEVWQFMSDDLAILDREGTLHFCPLSLNIFPYNTAEFEELRDRLVKPMRGLERAQWHLRKRLFGKAAVARRVPASPRPLSRSSCGLGLCLSLQGSDDERPVTVELSPERLAGVAKNVLMYELRQALPMFTVANAFCGDFDPPLPSPDAVARSTERVVAEALRHSRTLAVNVPRGYGSQALGRVLEELWEREALPLRGRGSQERE